MLGQRATWTRRSLTVKAHAFSLGAAAEKIKAAGGSVEVVE